MKKIITLTLLSLLASSFGQTEGKKTSELSARPVQAGDKVIITTALGANAAGNIGDDVVALQTEDARLNTEIGLRAPIDSPDFTGGLSVVTPSGGGWHVIENGTSAPNIVGGYFENSIAAGASRSIIAGGGQESNVNLIGENSFVSVISGGYDNVIGQDSQASSIHGGAHHRVTAGHGTVGGGSWHTVSGTYGGVFSGTDNEASGTYSGVFSGSNNTASGFRSVVSGGSNNVATGVNATVPGGENLVAGGDHSFVWGYRATGAPTSDGSFVLKDAAEESITVTAANTFHGQFTNGYVFDGGNVTTEGSVGVGIAASGLAQLRVQQDADEASGGLRIDSAISGGLNLWHTGTAAVISEGGVASLYADGGNVGVGVDAPAVALHVIDTEEQLRIGYDANNYFSTSVSVAGVTTLDTTGNAGFIVADDIDFSDYATFNDQAEFAGAGVGIGINNGGLGRLRLRQDAEEANGGLRLETSTNSSAVVFWHDGDRGVIQEGGLRSLQIEGRKTTLLRGAFAEQVLGVEAVTPTVDQAIIYSEDDGAGNTRLMVQFPTGDAQQILSESVGSSTYDPPSLADGSGVTTTVTVAGAVLGEYAEAAFAVDTQGVSVSAWVSAADTVSVRFQNETGGVVDLASGTLNARAN